MWSALRAMCDLMWNFTLTSAAPVCSGLPSPRAELGPKPLS